MFFEKKIIPNCNICKWMTFPSFTQQICCLAKCTAQGFKPTDKAYNNRLCKKLYEPESKEVINDNSKCKMV